MPTRQRFSRSSRLLSPGDFKPVFDAADVKASTREALILARRSDLDHCRLGLVIAKKHVRLAVNRNRVKRAVREHFRLTPLPFPCDIVFLARSGAGQLDKAALQSTLHTLWSRLDRELQCP